MIRREWKKILALLCIVSILCTGIFWISTKASKYFGNSDTPETYSSNSGQQEFSVVSDKYIVKDGESEYKLLIPTDAGELIQTAATEFNTFFKEATGLSLTVVTNVSSSDKFISIGQTDALGNTDITYEYSDLGRDGYKIVTKGDDVYLIGGSDRGSLYAVYELLEFLIDYDFFAEDCYTVTRNVTELPLYDFQLMDVPDIAIRTASDGVVIYNKDTINRMRQEKHSDDFVLIDNLFVHNSLAYVQGSTNSNWRWYDRTNATQLCYTAKGDQEQYQKMLEASLATMKDALMKNTKSTTIAFSGQDNSYYCSCAKCLEVKSQYGAISATVILYLNDLYDMVSDWFETEEGKPYARDLKLLFTAYNAYEAAPSGITMNKGVGCLYAPIAVDYYAVMNDNNINQTYYNTLQNWANLTDNLYLWFYGTNFWNYLAPYDNFASMESYYELAAQHDAVYLFDQRQHDEGGFVTGWSNLKSYLSSKLSWNASEDSAVLTDKFFDGYFGPAATDMRKVFDGLNALTATNRASNGLGGRSSVYQTVAIAKFWPQDTLDDWLGWFDDAEAKIADLKTTNPTQYELYKKHIDGEKLSVLYLYVECYGSSVDVSAYKAEFKEIADSLGLTRYREGGNISVLYSNWGIN